jgi:predicted aspartyl protease
VVKTLCGFNDTPGAPGCDLLTSLGPTIFVDIGFDPNFNPQALAPPVPGIVGVKALVDTGASECCIDSLLAHQLGLPIVDRRQVSGVGGQHMVNMHMAQVSVPTLNHRIYGLFAGVNLVAGGQFHQALMGRTFLKNFTMIYEGRTGTVTITSE